MLLSNFTIVNYKSCRLLDVVLDPNSPNIFIGINDSGKSSLLKALDLFFDIKQSIYLVNDKSIRSDLSNTPINIDDLSAQLKNKNLPEFSFETKDKIILLSKFIYEEKYNENDVSEQLLWAFDSSQEIWIAKVFDQQNTAGIYYLLNKDFNSQQLWLKKDKELKTLMDEIGKSSSDVTNVNQAGKPTNIERIRTIYNSHAQELSCAWCQYDFRKERNLFPFFRLLTWNSDLEDLKGLVTDAMKDNIKELEEKIYSEAKITSEKATEIVNQQLSNLTKEFINELPSINTIKANIKFNVSTSATDILVEKDNCDGLIHIESQGEGIKRQIWFVLLKWLSRKNIKTEDKVKKIIWCFDEPETHLYPSAQRDFISSLNNLCQTSYQSLISTHSTIFVDKTKLSNVNKIFIDDKYSKIIRCENIDDVYSALQIKNSDFLFYDKFLAVEGATEYKIIPHLYFLNKKSNLFDENIQLINLGGKSNWTKNKIILDNLIKNFSETQKILYYLLDSDTNCKNKNIKLIGKMDIEDSFPNSLWLKITNDLFPELNIQETVLNDIRNKIDSNKENKFYCALNNKIRSLTKNEKYLPSKGDDLADLIIKHITDAEIPSEINDLFSILING